MKLLGNKVIASTCFGLILSGCTTINHLTLQPQNGYTCKAVDFGTMSGALIGSRECAVIGGAGATVTGGVIGHKFDAQNEELRKTLAGTAVQVKQEENSIQLIMASDKTFQTNHEDVSSSIYPTLRSVATVLKKYRDINITVTGYTDNVGNAAHNQQLSEERARSVGNYFILRGLSPNRISTQGFGNRHPIVSNETAAGRAINRRVVITLR